MYINISDLDLIGLVEMELPLYLKEPITIKINNLDNVIHTAFQACWLESLNEWSNRNSYIYTFLTVFFK